MGDSLFEAEQGILLGLDRLAGMRTQRVVEAEAVEQFDCPRCKVPAGRTCVTWLGDFWHRSRPHQERVICAALVNGGVTDDG